MTDHAFEAPPVLGQIQQRTLVVGVVALVIGIAGIFISGSSVPFFRAYLIGFIFCLGLCLGSMALLMIQHMAGGGWSLVIRRILEASTRTIALLFVLFLPIAFGIHQIYEWSNKGVKGSHKQIYLSLPFFYGRAAFYFIVWGLLIYFLNKLSRRQDSTKDIRLVSKMQNISGPGLVLFGLTITFASTDWLLSLDPEWFSTIYGMLIMAGEGLSALAFSIAFAVLLSKRPPMDKIYKPHYFHDLGKLMLAIIMIWAYFSFSQLLIIWAGNLPEEIPWYIDRLQTNWKWVGLALVLFHFALPFVLLLSRDLKRDAKRLVLVAGLVLVARFIDVIWLIVPEFHRNNWFSVSWLDIVVPVGMVGIWFWYFLREYRKWPIMPIGAPNLEEVLESAPHH